MGRFAERMALAVGAMIVAVCCSASIARSYDAQLRWWSVASAAGYKIYVRQGSGPFGAGIDVGHPAPDADGRIGSVVAGLPTGVLSHFAVTAYDVFHAESALSNEISLLVVGTPTLTASSGATPPRTPTSTAPSTSTVPPPSRTRTATRTATVSPIRSLTPTPTATPTPDLSVGGEIHHWRTGAPVDGVTVALMGSEGTATAVTDELGQFSFGALALGTWLMQPQKRGDGFGAISALDGARVLQSVAGLAQLSDVQRLACDVTGNGQLSAFDATRILQLAVGLIVELPIAGTCGSDWAFLPEPTALPYQPCQPGSIVVDPLLGDVPRQDFAAVLFGDCTGNWNAPALARARLALSRNGRVRLGAPRRRGSGRWALPLFVDSPEPYLSVAVRVSYDVGRTRSLNVLAASATYGALLRYDTDDDGVLTIALASATPFTADGPVATLLFESPSRRADSRIARLLSATIDEVNVGIVP